METIIRVAKTFVDDHIERELPYGRIVKETKTTYTLSCTTEEWMELLSDADHYSLMAGFYGSDYRHICSSATAVARAIRKQIPTAPAQRW